MFVIARCFSTSCEVFDSVSNKFISLNNITSLNDTPYIENNDCYSSKVDAITVGYKIYVFKKVLHIKRKRKTSTFNYDVNNNVLSLQTTLNILMI